MAVSGFCSRCRCLRKVRPFHEFVEFFFCVVFTLATCNWLITMPNLMKACPECCTKTLSRVSKKKQVNIFDIRNKLVHNIIIILSLSFYAVSFIIHHEQTCICITILSCCFSSLFTIMNKLSCITILLCRISSLF